MTDVTHRAMLASLTQRAWKATATDREVAMQAEQNADAETGTMRVIKELTPKQYIKPIHTIMTIGYTEHRSMTVPGFIRGQYLLATAVFDRYCQVHALVRDQFNEAVENFCNFYPNILDAAPKRLGKAFRENDFPTKHQIKGFFEYSIQFAPIPQISDWRLEGLSDQDTEKLRQEVEQNVKAMYATATQEVFDRARVILEKIVSQSQAYTGKFGGSAVLRDATIENLKEISELVCSMNISDDPLLAKIGQDMVNEFSNVKGAEIRKNAKVREDVMAAAQRILAKMN